MEETDTNTNVRLEFRTVRRYSPLLFKVDVANLCTLFESLVAVRARALLAIPWLSFTPGLEIQGTGSALERNVLVSVFVL